MGVLSQRLMVGGMEQFTGKENINSKYIFRVLVVSGRRGVLENYYRFLPQAEWIQLGLNKGSVYFSFK